MKRMNYHFILRCILFHRIGFSAIHAFSLPNQNSVLSPLQINGINAFTSEVAKTVINTKDEPSDFLSFTLKGVKAPRKTKKMSEAKREQVDKTKEELRGKIREVHGRLITLKSKKKGAKVGRPSDGDLILIQTTIKFHGATDVAQNFKLRQVEDHLKCLFVGNTSDAQSTSEWGEVEFNGLPIQTAELKTINGDWKLDLKQTSSKKMCKFIKNKGKKTKEPPSPRTHDQKKNVLLSPSAPFFQKLGITDADGKPRIARSSKLRQCQKFVEIVSRLVDSSKLALSADELKVVDMGCGRGYLTFSLHSHLYDNYQRVQSRGIDVRPKLMNEVNAIARDLGESFDGLQFTTGTIENAEIDGDIDVLIALHACDTATDDSLWYGLKKNAEIIVSAPCCHKEVRYYLDAHVAKTPDHPYADILRHNIYKERVAETVTDSIRALLLELSDYNVQVFEFIGGEHTSKNVMLSAVKRSKPRSEIEREELRARLQSLAELHGIKRQKLADLVGEPMHTGEIPSNAKRSRRKGAKTGMPSL